MSTSNRNSTALDILPATRYDRLEGVLMTKQITVSELRAKVRHVLNEVQYSQIEYIVDKFGEPAVVIINLETYRLLQAARGQTEQADNESDDRGPVSAGL